LEIVDAINAGRSHIHEHGLDDLLGTHGGDALTTTTDYADIRDTDVTFLAFQISSREDGSIDTPIIEAAAETFGETLRVKDGDHVVVTKNTVIPTTTTETLSPIVAEASTKSLGDNQHVTMNPEFLPEGTAV